MMTETQEALSGDRLICLLEEQQALYRQLRSLADRQKTLVTSGDTETLLKLLSERQRLVDGLVALNASLSPYRESWPEFYARLDEPHRRRASELLEEVNGSLSSILQSDRNDSATLTAKRQEISGQLANYDNGRRASAAYGRQDFSERSALTDSKV